jgi:hypothetical protein
MNLTINNDCNNNTIAAVNQDHKKNNHAQKTPEISWENPSQPREKPSNPLLYCQEKIHHPPPNPSTQEGASMTEKTSA